MRRGGAENAGSKSRTGSGTDAVSRRPVQVPLIMQTMRHSPRNGHTLRAARYHYINFEVSIQLPVANLSGVMVGLGNGDAAQKDLRLNSKTALVGTS